MSNDEVQAARDAVEYELELIDIGGEVMAKVDALIAVCRRRGGIARTQCHPEANGRVGIKGEYKWTFTFTLEDGSVLDIEIGREAHDDFRGFVLREEIDDAADDAETSPS